MGDPGGVITDSVGIYDRDRVLPISISLLLLSPYPSNFIQIKKEKREKKI